MIANHCFFTSFNKAYAPQAILLAESIRRHHGTDVKIYGLLVDELNEDEEHYLRIFDCIIKPTELNIPNFNAWIFGLNIVEAATAVKPFALCYLLEIFSHVTYLDPDIILYSKLEEVFDPLSGWDVALTPHQITPKNEQWLVESTELESLRFGVYNLGFLSVKSSDNGRNVARWWRDRCYDYCVIAPERGLFTDQKFFDIAPAIFSGIHILRHPGYNVASWNLSERYIKFENYDLKVNESSLRFCHFTKASHIGAFAVERMLTKGNFFLELFYTYIAQLNEKKASLDGLSQRWKYGFFNDGSEIDSEQRLQFRLLKDSRFKYENPFFKNWTIESNKIT